MRSSIKVPSPERQSVKNPENVSLRKSFDTKQEKVLDLKPNQQTELKHVQDQIELMNKKVLLLRQQLRKEQQLVKVNKSKTEDVIRKKINVNRIQQLKQKDSSEDQERTQLLRHRNATLRKSHQNEMQDILKAIYLVKLDDAREVKNQSLAHKRRISELNESIWSERVSRKNKIIESSQKAKERYQEYQRKRFADIRSQQYNNSERKAVIDEKKNELKELQKMEIKLLEDMNKMQMMESQAKKQYLAAISLPVREVGQAINRPKERPNNNKSALNDISLGESSTMKKAHSDLTNAKKSLLPKNEFLEDVESMKRSQLSQRMNSSRQVRVPHTAVNKDKLKKVLIELKKMHKEDGQ